MHENMGDHDRTEREMQGEVRIRPAPHRHALGFSVFPQGDSKSALRSPRAGAEQET